MTLSKSDGRKREGAESNYPSSPATRFAS